MKITSHQLTVKELAPLYFVHGNDILLVDETVQKIRTAAITQGYLERISLSALSNSEWSETLYAAVFEMSLLSQKRIIELSFLGDKPKATQTDILVEIAKAMPGDIILVVISGKCDAKTESTKWFKQFEKNAVIVAVWPIREDQLPTWLIQRARSSGLQLTHEAARFLATHTEGNLLAAAQEIEKLSLLNLPTKIDVTLLAEWISDLAVFDVYQFIDSMIAGNVTRARRILHNLHLENAEPILLLWAITRELRTLAEMQQQLHAGASFPALFSKFRVWEKRQACVRTFLNQHSKPAIYQFLSHAATLDKMIKGAKKGNVWLGLEQLCVMIASKLLNFAI